jgi:glycosyltransferase involved in cell wall biosynthesis
VIPTLLILTDDCVSPSHGTGAALLRQLKEFPPAKLPHGYLNRKGDPFLPRSYHVDPKRNRPGSWWRGLPGQSPEVPPHPGCSTREFLDAVLSDSAPIDLVYSCVFGETGLRWLSDILDRLPPGTPAVHHANDFLYDRQKIFENLLRKLSPRIAEFWAIGQKLAEEVERITGREAVLMTPFQCDIQPDWKQAHREFGSDCKAVMLGNSHMPFVLHHLRNVWSEVGKECPGIQPIQWYAYPSSVSYVEDAGVAFGPEIEYAGFLDERTLHEQLCSADFAIVPFNIHDEPEYHYAEFSIPSRITEFVNAGLPIFAAAGTGTEACRFITENEIGLCKAIADEEAFTESLLRFAHDTEGRKRMGAHNRRFSESECDIRRYRTRLLKRFNHILGTRQTPPPAGATQP